MKRRDFLKASALTSSSLLLARPASGEVHSRGQTIDPIAPAPAHGHGLPDLSPARWIWYPSGRTLPNTFILFRREFTLESSPRRATGWICADSRYQLEVNGRRVQWGPAPSDPRWSEADPLDLRDYLQPGPNVLGATVLFYGAGDGTWPIGKPGFLFWLELEHADGRVEHLVSDPSWRAFLCRAWPPGHYKRWYLRALQEEFDARLYPYDWHKPGFPLDSRWLAAMPLPGSPNRPALSAGYDEYLLNAGDGPPDTELRPRSIPMLREWEVPAAKLAESYRVRWRVTPQEYFEFRTPGAFEAERAELATEAAPGQWQVELDGHQGTALTFEFAEQVVGWPGFSIQAPAGTTIELLVHEAHAPGGPPLLNTHFDCWHHYRYTADLEALREPFPRLVGFARFLQTLTGLDGLLPVENIGIPSVWMDHVAYQRQRHKQCAFNLYAAAAMEHALAPLCRAFGQVPQAEAAAQFGRELLTAAVRAFWSADRGLFVNNLPWLSEEKTPRTCDRSLATAVFYDQCPAGQTSAAVRSLAECPAEMGLSYPCNAGWRLWALARCGRADVIVSDLRKRWATMSSVKENNTLQEDWQASHDSGQQWSHCDVVPAYIALHGLLGLAPLEPGFKRFEVRPQLSDLQESRAGGLYGAWRATAALSRTPWPARAQLGIATHRPRRVGPAPGRRG